MSVHGFCQKHTKNRPNIPSNKTKLFSLFRSKMVLSKIEYLHQNNVLIYNTQQSKREQTIEAIPYQKIMIP